MGGAVQKIFAILLNTEFIAGCLLNGFIATVNCVDWVKRRKMSPVDQILTALAISRFNLFWLSSLDWWAFVLAPGVWNTGKMLRILYIPWTVMFHFSSWLATSLSIFYFLKIANFSNSIFLYLKWRVQKVVSVTLLMSLFLLSLNIVTTNIHITIRIEGCKVNSSYTFSTGNPACFSSLLLLTNIVFVLTPFTVSLIASLLLILSLWQHRKTKQWHTREPRDASTTAHTKALQTVMVSLLLYVVFLMSHFVRIWNFKSSTRSPLLLICQVTGIAFPLSHSCVLIVGNRKLRRASLSVLNWLRPAMSNT